MRKVYCDMCGTPEKDLEFIFYTRTEFIRGSIYNLAGGKVETEYEVCPKCDKKIKEEFENGKNDKTFRKCHHCGCEFCVAYSGNIDGKKYCSTECWDADKKES